MTTKQRAALRAMCNTMEPVLHIGKEGITDNLIKQCWDALEEGTPFEVEVQDGVYYVSGREMVRLLDSVNFDNEESLNWFHRSLRRLGVIDALRRQGAQEGDSVLIGDMEFDFID